MGQVQDSTKQRKWKHLSEKERYKIEALCQQGYTAAQIGAALSPRRHRRTIEREIARGLTMQRNSDLTERMVYLADVGQRVHDERAANKGRGFKIGHDHKLATYIEDRIKKDKWSPDVVIGRIREEGIPFETSICTKTLYNYIDRGLFAGISNNDLWVKRDSRKRGYKRVRTIALNNRSGKSIDERPKEAEERTERGHWEIDFVIGKQGTTSAVMTLVDRKTRKSIYVLTKNRTQNEVSVALKRVKRRKGSSSCELFKTITADNGSEFLDSESIKKAAQCDEVYYAHPYSSFERASNENGNRILRRFLPKGTDFGKLTARDLQWIEDWVNNYPRKIFGYRTANEIVAQTLAES